MRQKLSGLWMVTGISLLMGVLMWLPFVAKIVLPGWGIDFTAGTSSLWSNYDGPNYVIVAKSWYDKDIIRSEFSNPLPLEYYPAHLPFYPATIALLNLVMSGPWAMLVSTLIGSVLASAVFYWLAAETLGAKKAKILALVFMVFPARWLVVKTIGSPEPWFTSFVLLSLWFYRKDKIFWAAAFGVLAQWTKSPAVLLFAAYVIDLGVKYWKKPPVKLGELARIIAKYWSLALMPLSGLLLFGFYMQRTGDFWAYFHSGDNFHLFFPPFSIFAPKGQVWVGDYWLEEIILVWLIYGIGVIRLFKEKMRTEAIFGLVFWVATLMVAHRDVSRYILPIAPLVLMGYNKLLVKKEILIVIAVIGFGVILYSWNFILNNIMPVADWAAYL